MRILVLSNHYPVPNGSHARMFVHVRDVYYRRNGMDVTVVNFATDQDYEIDGIRVIKLSTFEAEKQAYDVCISHSANMRHHYLFLKKYEHLFPRLLFFFHGFEISYMNHDYPEPYAYVKPNIVKKYAVDAYDCYKIWMWRKFYKKLASKSEFIFVSNSHLERFQKNTHLKPEDLQGHVHIIHNSVGETFETECYPQGEPKLYDFITIRSDLDGSKYCADLVVKAAKTHPERSFLLIGKGRFFEHYDRPSNLAWVSDTLSHAQIVGYLKQSRCALMPTRWDTQGVMTCEMITFGMPVITSDIDVCREFFDGIPNVRLWKEDDNAFDFDAARKDMEKNPPSEKCDNWFAVHTIRKEMDLICGKCVPE